MARKADPACWCFEALEESRSVNYLNKLLGTKEDLVPPRLPLFPQINRGGLPICDVIYSVSIHRTDCAIANEI